MSKRRELQDHLAWEHGFSQMNLWFLGDEDLKALHDRQKHEPCDDEGAR